MTKLQKLSGFAVLVQATLWVILLLFFFILLPQQGFSKLDDFNNQAKVASTPLAMLFIVWSDVLFGLTMMICVYVLYKQMRTHLPPILVGLVTIVLLGVVTFFLWHDIGIHLIGWSAIERNPAATNYAMDRVLWAFRNGVFFVVSILTFLATNPADKFRSAILMGPLAKSG